MSSTADFSRIDGKIKPLHGVNNGPKGLNFGIDNSQYFIDAAIPHCRLHDTEYPYGSGVFVDIHCIFPDFDKNPNDPESYHFYHTDDYIKSIIDVGANVVYRLGESIDHRPKKTYIYPPRDFKKWAKICAGIIRHYNYGWADGFHFNIEYWEIWNEPDNGPVIESNPMWQGTAEQYYELYAVTARHLKSEFPEIKVGGYASCGFYAILARNNPPAAGVYGRNEYFIDFLEGFLKYITSEETKAPIDFFSWHSYSWFVQDNVLFARYARSKLDSFGLTQCESSLNEWNIRPCRFDKPFESAAVICANFCALSAEKLDSAQYYDAQGYHRYCGLFDLYTMQALPSYYAFRAFGELYRLGSRCFTQSENEQLYLCAASDGETKKLLAVNFSDKKLDCEIEIVGAEKIISCRSVSDGCLLESKNGTAEKDGSRLKLHLDAYEIALTDME